MKKLILILALLLSSCSQQEKLSYYNPPPLKPENIASPERQAEFLAKVNRLRKFHGLEPIDSKFHKGLRWTLENFVTQDGWSLTGYSSTKLDSNMNPYRWKIGIVSPEITYDHNPAYNPELRDPFNPDGSAYAPAPIGIGFHFRKEF